MANHIVIKKITTYYSQIIPADTADQAEDLARELDGNFEEFEQDTEIYSYEEEK